MNKPKLPKSKRNNSNQQHRFIRRTQSKPLISETNKISAYIINHLRKENFSVSQLKKLGQLHIQWGDKKGNHKSSFSLEDISGHIRTSRAFDHTAFNLPTIECDWLDGFVGIAKPDAPIATIDGKHFAPFALPMSFGNNFPIMPCIDREGVVYRTLQTPLMKNIIRLFNKLVDQSHRAPKLDGIWLNDLRMLLNDCVSILEVTLHQLYFVAQYKGSDMGWDFDTSALGLKENVRIKDKLRWVGKITGRPLDNARDEVKHLLELKDIRNHLNHFDPPCFAYTVEDTVRWLNHIPALGRLLWKIRDKLNVQLTSLLVEIILLPHVEFAPRNPDAPRVPQTASVGYLSSTWPK